jgi:hypothetical protein
MEYSVWTWRWTKESWEPFAMVAGYSSAVLGTGGLRACLNKATITS